VPCGRAAIIATVSESTPSVRPPQQRRSRDSYQRVLEAAHALLEENGFDGFTVQEVARRSGVSVGAIYERFGNKETLLRAVHARLMEWMTRASETAGTRAVPREDAAEAVADAVASVAQVMGANRKVLRAFMHLGAVDEVISKAGSQSSRAQCASFKRALMPYLGQFGHPQPEVALDVAFRVTYSTLARQVMYGPVFESDVRVSWKRLVAELGNLSAAYLGVDDRTTAR
jgi:AcrR family transcriptional regulator